MWSAEQVKGSKRVKAEVAITTSPEIENQPEGVSQEAYELMIKGKSSIMKSVLGCHLWVNCDMEVCYKREIACFSLQKLLGLRIGRK